MYCYTTGREIIAKKTLITHRLSGKAYEDLDSNIVIVIFYLLNDIIVVLLFTMVAEFEPRSVVCIQCILCMKFHIKTKQTNAKILSVPQQEIANKNEKKKTPTPTYTNTDH